MRITRIQENIMNIVLQNGSNAATIAASIFMEGKGDPDFIRMAIRHIYKINSALRIRLNVEQGQLVQNIGVYTEKDVDILYFKDANECKKWCADMTEIPLDYMGELSFATGFVWENKFGIYFKMHHIIGDAYSLALIARQFKQIYAAYLKGEEPEVEVYGIDVIVDSEEKYFNGNRYQKDREYWHRILERSTNVAVLTTKVAKSSKATRLLKKVDREFTDEINEYCERRHITPFALFMAALGIYVNLHTGENDFFIGTTFYNRSSSREKYAVGMCANTAVIPFSIQEDYTIADYFAENTKTLENVLRHSKYPYMEVLQDAYENMNTRGQLYDLMLSYQPSKTILESNDEIIVYFQKSQPESLSIDIFCESDDNLLINYDYNDELFEEWEVQSLHSYYMNILTYIIRHDSSCRISDIVLVDTKEKELVLQKFNATAMDYDREKTVVHLYEEQVVRTPDRNAVVFGQDSYTYTELNERANALAYRLRALSIGPEDFVAMITERSLEMIAGIYGILKAGGAYVPIDPDYPDDRVRYMLKDCMPKAILIYGERAKKKAEATSGSVPILDLGEQGIWEGETCNPQIRAKKNNLAYMIYTSGTTGAPKGVAIEHMGLHNLVAAYTDIYKLTERDIVLQVANYIFDQSVWDIFNILMVGGTLCLISYDDIRNPRKIEAYCREKKVTVASFTPALIREINPDGFPTLRILDSSGEAASADVLTKWTSRYQVINTYGPTEVTVNSSSYTYTGKEIYNIPIGGPIANYQFYVIKGKQICGIGMPGELCIAGDGIARGYYNRPELTQKAFVANPFGKGKMYRTGDLVRWLPTGIIEYITRMDEQVKVRGFRIELGDVEYAIKHIDGIKDAVAMVRLLHDEKYLCAYYIYDKDYEKDESVIRNKLSSMLPGYMIPSVLIRVDSFPLSPSGKLNRKALPDLKEEDLFHTEFFAAADEWQAGVTDCFKEVLKIERLGIRDNFFNLGGHSLKASAVVNLIEKKFSVRLQIRDIFSYPTAELLAELLRGTAAASQTHIPEAGQKEYYKISPSQRNIYLAELVNDVKAAYHMPGVMRATGAFDMERFKTAVEQIAKRNEILRTGFRLVEEEPVQFILDKVILDIREEDLTSYSENDIANWINKQIKAFKFDCPPLLHIAVGRVKEAEWLIFFDIHHIISDGVSVNLMIREIMGFYEGEKPTDHRIQYKDYSEWMAGREWKQDKNFWLGQLDREVTVLNLPMDYSSKNERDFAGDTVLMQMDHETRMKMKKFCLDNELTEYMFLLAASMVLISKHCAQTDIIMGTPVTGRTNADEENMLGPFVNTLLMRGKPEEGKTWMSFLTEMKAYCLQAYAHQEYAYADLIDELHKRDEFAQLDLLKCMFTMQNTDEVRFDLKGVTIKILREIRQFSKFNLEFEVTGDLDYTVALHYKKMLFDKEHIEYMLKHYMKLLAVLLETADQAIGDYDIMSDDEIFLVKEQFNRTDLQEACEDGICSMLLRQARKTPYKTAVVYEGKRITYTQLVSMADKVAGRLTKAGVGINDCVPLITAKSVEMIIGIWGILRAGAAYVPIDISCPLNRIRDIISDSASKVIVTYGTDMQWEDSVTQIALEDLDEMETESVQLPKEDPENLAYIIYTSGTTGKAKGVMIARRNLLNLCMGLHKEIYREYDSIQVAMVATYAFDASVKQIFMSLLYGHTLHVISDETKYATEKMAEYLCRENIVISDGTPSYIMLLLENLKNKECRTKIFLSGGEKMKKNLVDSAALKGIRIINVYGPTETTVDATLGECRSQDDRNISIGSPLPNVKIYIMKDGKLCGIGIPGEICIAGRGVGNGYRNMKKLTEEKFTDCPYTEGRMYHTGDLARWRADGKIEYIGRMDDQIKLNGFRIELEEIESVAEQITGGRCVAAVKPIGKREALCLYYETGCDIGQHEIKECICSYLPQYMVPEFYMQISEVPYTINGKTDRKHLPEIISVIERSCTGPDNEKEQILLEIFKEVLGRENISVLDDFYKIGGDSISAIRIASKLNERNYAIKAQDIMLHQNIRSIQEWMKTSIREFSNAEVSGVYKPTPIQMRFFQKGYAHLEHYNQSFVFDCKIRLEEELIRQALAAVVRHHDVLRSIFTPLGQRVQPADESCLYDWEKYDMVENKVEDEAEFISRRAEALQRGMDLERGPLVKAALFKGAQIDRLLLSIHHLVTDAVSWRIFLEDLQSAYEQLMRKDKLVLPGKTSSYPDWSNALNIYSVSWAFERDLGYWTENAKIIFGSIFMEKNTENTATHKKIFIIDSCKMEKLTDRICQIYLCDMQDVMLTLFARAVCSLKQTTELVIDLESHGRDEINTDIQTGRTIGWFTAVAPVVIQIREDSEWNLVHVKDRIRMMPKNRQSYGVAKYIRQIPQLKEDSQLCFNYLGVTTNEQNRLFMISDISSGQDSAVDNRTGYAVTCDCSIMNGIMRIELTYHTAYVSEEEIDIIGCRMVEEADRYINGFVGSREIIKAASDYDEALDEDTLNEILAMF